MSDLKPKLSGFQRQELKQHIRKNDLDADGIATKYGIAMSTVARYYKNEGVSLPKGRPNKPREVIKSQDKEPEPVEQSEEITRPDILPEEDLIGSAKHDSREEIALDHLIPKQKTEERDYCGFCVKEKKEYVYLDRSMKHCPGCKRLLLW